MNATRKVKLKDIKLNLTCKLCLGYLVDATTIIECLHSFCKSCIINYLEKSDREEKYCPVCDVQLHSTKPLTSIRSDLMLQEIVYKLVPGLFKNEMRRRREFYANNDDSVPTNPLDSGQVFDELYITSDDVMHLSMEYVTDDDKLRENTKRYLKCPAAVSIFVLKKLLQGKYDLDVDTSIDIMFGDRILPDDFLLMDVAYKYSWTKNGNKPLSLRYRIRGHVKPVIELERTINDSALPVEPHKGEVQEDVSTPPANKKKVCNENGSNIMPSEEVKSPQIKLPTNGLLPGEVAIAPTKAVNMKVKGRKRKHLNYSDIIIESKDDIKNLAKRLKLEKSTVKSGVKKSASESSSNAQTQVETIVNNNNNGSPNRVSQAKDVSEVQLQISENGVMSARSVSSSGNDKVVYDLSKRVCKPTAATTSSNTSPITLNEISLTEKLLLSGNFHSKTGPSGVTEIICDKPDPISSTLKPSSAKPGYVTLNIPTPKNPMASQNGRIVSNGSVSDKKKNTSGQNGSLASGAKSNEKMNSNKSDVLDKIRQKFGKGPEGDTTLSELGKLCNNVGTSMDSGNSMEGQRMSGMHSLPIVSPMSNSFQQPLQRAKTSNEVGKNTIGTENFTLPIALNFSPASGMSVSMIPCTSSSSSSTGTGNSFPGTTSISSISSHNTTPPKRPSHQTSIVNGDLKFTSSPKLILPKPSGNHEASPKKPPKFFKSRRVSSPGSSPLSGKYSTPGSHKSDKNNELKRKTPVTMLNGNGNKGAHEPLQKKISKERKEQAKESSNQPVDVMSFMKLLSSGALTANVIQPSTSTSSGKPVSSSHLNATSEISNAYDPSRPLTFPAQANDKYSAQHLSVLSNLAGVSSSDVLNSSIGIAAMAAAAAAANGNGLPVGMVPFVTDSYCSLPYLNQRLPMTQFPYGFGFPTGGFSVVGSNTNLTTATTTPVNSSKSKSSTSISSAGNNSQILNGLLAPTSSNNNDSPSYLDLSIAKSLSNEKTSLTNTVSNSNPLLVGLLNSSNSKSPNEKKNSEAPQEPTPPTSNGHAPNVSIQVKSREKSKSPIIKQLLEKSEESGNSPMTSSPVQCNGVNGISQQSTEKSDSERGKDSANGQMLMEYLKNGTGEKSTNSSPSKPGKSFPVESSCSDNLTESKSSVSTDSLQMKNDNDSNILNSINNIKTTLDKEKLLCLSAQNNNIHTLSNNHDKPTDSTTNNKSDNLDSSNVIKRNETSDNNVSSDGTQLSSCKLSPTNC